MSKNMRFTITGTTEWNGDYTCDSCGRQVREVTTVKSMDFCPKCYQETFGDTNKDQQIERLNNKVAELEKRLENGNYPKYKLGQKVYVVCDREVFGGTIERIEITDYGTDYYMEEFTICFCECELFVTKEEAEQKLAEMEKE